MKLILQIKLLPTPKQAKSLLNTIKECNKACNNISEIVWQNKTFNQYKAHHLVYYKIRSSFNLSAQVVIRCISKVINSYKLDKKRKRVFKPLGAIAYDSRILSYNKRFQEVSIWSVDGRLKIPFVCYNPKYLPYIKGEADLVTKKSKFYLFQTVEVPEDNIKDVEEFIGVDFGIINLAVTSDGEIFSGDQVNKIRKKSTNFKRKLQKRSNKNAKRKLKKYSGKERRFKRLINHTISKQIVSTALKTRRAIALEDLKGFKPTVRKAQREIFGKWAFSEFRGFIEYKAKLMGIPVIIIDPAFTSQTCSACGHIAKSNRKSQALFSCMSCGKTLNADINSAIVIAQSAACKPTVFNLSPCSMLNRSSSGTESPAF